jgi:hypothetical protein
MDLDEARVAAAWDANAATWVEQVRAGHDLYREVFTMPAFLGSSRIFAGCVRSISAAARATTRGRWPGRALG